MDYIFSIFPHLKARIPTLIDATFDTLTMFLITGSISFILGIVLGVTLVVTKRGGLYQNIVINSILEKIINLFRSIPFIILITLLIPISRLITGTGIGIKGALFPLIIGTVPFFAKQIESAISSLDSGLIEAGKAMGDSPLRIIFKIYLKESIPEITRVTIITAISLIGLTTMAGAVGAGGLGDVALRYGHGNNQWDISVITILIILIIVTIIQTIGNFIIKKTTH